MKNIIFPIILGLGALTLNSCDTDPEALEIQKPFTYSEKYYEDLRAYKETDHQIAFVWFSDYNKATSMANRFMGLPDSVDICSLWGGIPSPEGNPLAYDEMKFVQRVKGMKLVIPTIVRIEDKVAYGDQDFYKLFQESYQNEDVAKREQAIKLYADYLLKPMWEHGLDGLDLDYEPEGDRLSGENFTYFVEYLGEIIGPKSKNPDKLLIVDFYGHYPDSETEPFVSYFVRQAYATGNASGLQSMYRDWIPTRKFIVTENIGDHWQTGGVPFTDADGNTLGIDGNRLYSLEGMARWNPTQGLKGGFGAFFAQRDYSSTPPYKYLRRGIQAQNPAVK